MRATPIQISIALLVLSGCRSTSPSGPFSASLAVAAGQAFTVHLGTIGPGTYSTPPTVSSTIIQFISESPDTGLASPAGERQAFDFRAKTPGVAAITFTHTGSSLPGQDSAVTVVDQVTVY